MTTTQTVKEAMIAYLTANTPSTSITITDANARDEIEMPCLAVDLQGSEAHSVALQMVNRAEVAITLRAHAGDEADAEIDAWIGAIELLLHDHSQMVRVLNESGVQFYEWVYAGSVQTWDAATVEIEFRAQVMFARI